MAVVINSNKCISYNIQWILVTNLAPSESVLGTQCIIKFFFWYTINLALLWKYRFQWILMSTFNFIENSSYFRLQNCEQSSHLLAVNPQNSLVIQFLLINLNYKKIWRLVLVIFGREGIIQLLTTSGDKLQFFVFQDQSSELWE